MEEKRKRCRRSLSDSGLGGTEGEAKNQYIERICSKNLELWKRIERIKKKRFELFQNFQNKEEFMANTLFNQIKELEVEKNQMYSQMELIGVRINEVLSKKLEEITREKVRMEREIETRTEYITNFLTRKLQSVEKEKEDVKRRSTESIEPKEVLGVVTTLQSENENLKKEKEILTKILTQKKEKLKKIERTLKIPKSTSSNRDRKKKVVSTAPYIGKPRRIIRDKIHSPLSWASNSSIFEWIPSSVPTLDFQESSDEAVSESVRDM